MTEMPPGLSVNARGHLEKILKSHHLCSHSPEAELVRYALYCHATSIDIHVKSTQFILTHNGTPVSAQTLQNIGTICSYTAQSRILENAIISLKGKTGLNLLALFALKPKRIEISYLHNSIINTSVYSANRISHTYKTEKKIPLWTCRISLETPFIRTKETIARIKQQCRCISSTLTINSTAAKKVHLLTDQIITGDFSIQNRNRSFQLGIPAIADSCKITLLGKNIPWLDLNLPVQSGLVFHCAIEAEQIPDEKEICRYAAAAEKLYLYLAEKFNSLNGPAKKRFRHLLFTHFRLTGNRNLLKKCEFIRILGSKKNLGLKAVAVLAAEKTLQAVSENSVLNSLSAAGKHILVLNPEEMDFLRNHMGFAVSWFTPLDLNRIILRRYPGTSVKILFLSWLNRILFSKEASGLTAEEQRFIILLNNWLKQIQAKDLFPCTAAFAAKSFCLPFWKNRNRTSELSGMIFIARENRQIKKMMAVIKQKPSDHSWIFSLFLSSL